jgi:hypothetical protein
MALGEYSNGIQVTLFQCVLKLSLVKGAADTGDAGGSVEIEMNLSAGQFSHGDTLLCLCL